MRTLCKTILLTSIVLVACNSGSGNQAAKIQSSGTKHQLTTDTPALMRSIPVTALSLAVKINEIETRYQNSNNADGTWSIELDLLPNQEYGLEVSWYSSEFLLLEEFGRFTTPATGTTIEPVLDYRSAGRPEFDVDCDGISNLEEVSNGTSLTIAEGLSMSACSEDVVPVVFSDMERAWIFREYDSIEINESTEANETSPRFTKLDQTIQIDTSNTASNIGFITNLVNNNFNPATGETIRNAAWLSFRQRFDEPKFMEFAMDPAIEIVESDIPGQFCKPLASDATGIMCTVPYEWQENRWYTMTIEETTPTTWRAQVLDLETQVTQPIATFTTPGNLLWTQFSTGLIDYVEYTGVDCMSGLPASRITFKPAVVNNVPSGSTGLNLSSCVKGGAGWSEGLRTVQDALEYKLTLGLAPE